MIVPLPEADHSRSHGTCCVGWEPKVQYFGLLMPVNESSKSFFRVLHMVLAKSKAS